MTNRKSVKQIAAEIRSGRSVVEVVEESLAAAERANPEHFSFITIMRDQALLRAAKVDAWRREGHDGVLLEGVPFAAKDMFETAGVLTTGGSPVLKDNVPDTSALVIT
ncbi:amidase family protein, partial [Mesorhizobium sp. M0159]|uniref:amidase family protein n=1 Tax=Mesorhizobium sp. M0159 TaxID=2956900 RepID=UPI00333C058C